MVDKNKKDQFYDVFDEIEKSLKASNEQEENEIDDNAKSDDFVEPQDKELSENEVEKEDLDESIDDGEKNESLDNDEFDDEQEIEEDLEVEDVPDREDDIYARMKRKPSVEDDEPVRTIQGKTTFSKGKEVGDDLLVSKEDRKKPVEEEVDMQDQVEAEEERRAQRAEEKEKYRKYREKEQRHRAINEGLYKDAEKYEESQAQAYSSNQSESLSGIDFSSNSDDSPELEREIGTPKFSGVSSKNNNSSQDDKKKEDNAKKFAEKISETDLEMKNQSVKNQRKTKGKKLNRAFNSSAAQKTSKENTREMFYNNSVSNDGVFLKDSIPDNSSSSPLNDEGQMERFAGRDENRFNKGFSTEISSTMKVKSDFGVNKNASVYGDVSPLNKKNTGDKENSSSDGFKKTNKKLSKSVNKNAQKRYYKNALNVGLVGNLETKTQTQQVVNNTSSLNTNFPKSNTQFNTVNYNKTTLNNSRLEPRLESRNKQLFANSAGLGMSGTVARVAKDDYSSPISGNGYDAFKGINAKARAFESQGIVNDTVKQSRKFAKLKGDLNFSNSNVGVNQQSLNRPLMSSSAINRNRSTTSSFSAKRYGSNSSNFSSTNNSVVDPGVKYVKSNDDYNVPLKGYSDPLSYASVGRKAQAFESQGIVNDTVKQSRKFDKLKAESLDRKDRNIIKSGNSSTTLSSTISVGGNRPAFSSATNTKRTSSRAFNQNNFYSNGMRSKFAAESMKKDVFGIDSIGEDSGYFRSSYRNGDKNYSYQIGYSYNGIGSSNRSGSINSVGMRNISNDSIKNARLYDKLKGPDTFGSISHSYNVRGANPNILASNYSSTGVFGQNGQAHSPRIGNNLGQSVQYQSFVYGGAGNALNVKSSSAFNSNSINSQSSKLGTNHSPARNAMAAFAISKGSVFSTNSVNSIRPSNSLNYKDTLLNAKGIEHGIGVVEGKQASDLGSELKNTISGKPSKYKKESSREVISDKRGKLTIARKEAAPGIIENNEKLDGVKYSKKKEQELLRKNQELKVGKAKYKANLFGKDLDEQLQDFEDVKKRHEYTKGGDGVIRLGRNHELDALEKNDSDVFGFSKPKLDEFGNPIVDDGMSSISGFKGRVGNKNDFLGAKTVNSSIGKNSKMRVGNGGPLGGKMKGVGLTKGNAIVGNFMSQTGKTYGKKYDNPGGTFMTMPQMPKVKKASPSIGKGFSGLLSGAIAIGGTYGAGQSYQKSRHSMPENGWHVVEADMNEEFGNLDSDFYTEAAKKMIFARQKCYYEIMMGREPSDELKEKARDDLLPLKELENKHIRKVTLDGVEYSKEDLEFDNVKEWTEDKLSKAVGKPVVLAGKKANFRYVDEDWETLIGEDKFILQSDSDIVFPDGTGGDAAPASFFSNGGSLGSLRGADNAQKIWNALSDLGYSEAGIAGIMGNLMLESGLDPDIQEIGHSQQGYGLAQWTSANRKAGLKAYANSKGVPISDLQMQVEYLDLELRRDLPGLYNYLKTTNDYSAATDRFMNEYERPGIPNRGQRQSYAKEIWGNTRNLQLDEGVSNTDDDSPEVGFLDKVFDFIIPTSYADPISDPEDPDSETNRYADGIERAEKRKKEDKKYKVNGDEKVMTVKDGRKQKFIYTPWSRITRQGSDQLKLKQKEESYTSDGYGTIDGRFAVAVTPEYGKIGDKIDAYLDDGTKIPAIIVDIKNPADDNYEAVGHELSDGTLNVLEFYTNWEGRHSNPGEPGSGNRSEWSGKGVEKIVNLNDNYLGNTPGGSDGMEFGDEGANSGGTGADGVDDDTTLSAAVSMSDEEQAGQILFLREMLGLGAIGGFYKYPDNQDEYNKYILDHVDFAMTGKDAEITPNIDFEYVTVSDTEDRVVEDENGNQRVEQGKKYVELVIKNNVQCNLSYLEQHDENFNKWDMFAKKYGDKIPQSYIALNSANFEEIFNIDLQPQGYASSGSYITAGFAGAIDFNEVTGIPYLDFAIAVANDDRHGYSQGPMRDSLVDFDCSSLVYYSLQQTMFPQLPKGAFTTHNMGGVLMGLGYERHSGAGPFQVGDILVNSQTHTEMVVGVAPSGRPITVGAKSAEGGGIYGSAGDQTGREIMVGENYTRWESLYRPPKAMMNAIEQQNKATEQKKKIKEEKAKKEKEKQKKKEKEKESDN